MPQHDRPGGLVVIEPVRDWSCAECAGTGDFLRMDDAGPLCLSCADLGHLVFLPAGDAALTRRAAKASGLSAAVVRWSRSRKRYERQGVLVEEQALAIAERQCLSDEDARMRRRERDRERRASEAERFQSRLAEEIRRLSPAARPGGPRPSPATPACAAAAGSAGPPPAARWTRTPSRWPWPHPSGTRTPATTRCSCPVCRATPPATMSGMPSTGS